MVKQETRGNQQCFVCEECGVAYKEKKWAQRCEDWCKKHDSCNLEVIKHAIKA
ncbi:MAG: hypothetical protein ACPL4N_03185 [Candidatus Norongarragalinales archaeon]